MSFAEELRRQVYLFESQDVTHDRTFTGRAHSRILMADIVVLRRRDGSEEIIKNRYGVRSRSSRGARL